MILPKLPIIDNRTEKQLHVDNDCTCLNCIYNFPYNTKCDTCEQPYGPFTTRSNWTFHGIIMNIRDSRQHKVFEFISNTFSSNSAKSIHERIARFIEEAIELAQSENFDITELKHIVDYVYSRPKGEPNQEVGGVSITLLAYCEASKISAENEEIKELERILSLDPEYFRKRQQRKIDAGISKI